MSAIALVVAAVALYALAYRFYGAFIASEILITDSHRKTPAYKLENGYDYVPTNRWVLFGHQFAAIAGAGPLVGPVLAAQFGYLPGALWILIGAVVAGAVHDMVILFASVRHNGLSLIEIAKKEIGTFSGILTAIAVIFIIITALAGLALVVVNALFKSPWGTFTVGATIPIAILMGAYMKLGVMLLLAIGVIIVNPTLKMPAITQFIHGGGPIVPGKVWPFVFITIVCGALSGFHALISSGTTPKMIENERDILPIGYGAMLAEGFVAIMALIAATSLIPADYFDINVSPAVFAKLGMHPVDLANLSAMVGENVAGRPGGAVSLAVGMAFIFSKIPILESLMSYMYHFIILFEAMFVLTTVDAGTRVGRYLLQEAFGSVYAPFKDKNWWPGIILTSAMISFVWGYLVYGGDISQSGTLGLRFEYPAIWYMVEISLKFGLFLEHQISCLLRLLWL